MIPGSISKISEGIVPCADIIKVYNDLVRITGGGTINTINPGLGTAQGQFLMIVPVDGPITLGTRGNISSGLVIPRYHVVHLVFSKPLQLWLVPGAVPLGEEEDVAESIYVPFNAANFVADGGTWTFTGADSVAFNMYYIHGQRVTLSLAVFGALFNPSGTIKTVRMKLPPAVSALAIANLQSERGVWIGEAAVSPNITDPVLPAALPCYCAVADNLPVVGPYMGITLQGPGNFPANPALGFAIMATCTYILR